MTKDAANHKITYKITTTIILDINVKNDGAGQVNTAGNFTRSVIIFILL